MGQHVTTWIWSWCKICFPSCLALLAFFGWVSGSFSSTGGERARTGCVLWRFGGWGEVSGVDIRKPCVLRCFRGCGEKCLDWACCKTMCFTVSARLRRDASGLNVCESHVFYPVFGVAERSVWAGHVGESTSASSSRKMLPGSPTRFLPIPSFSLLPAPAGVRLSGVSL